MGWESIAAASVHTDLSPALPNDYTIISPGLVRAKLERKGRTDFPLRFWIDISHFWYHGTILLKLSLKPELDLIVSNEIRKLQIDAPSDSHSDDEDSDAGAQAPDDADGRGCYDNGDYAGGRSDEDDGDPESDTQHDERRKCDPNLHTTHAHTYRKPIKPAKHLTGLIDNTGLLDNPYPLSRMTDPPMSLFAP